MNHLARVPVKQRQVELKLAAMKVQVDLFGSQLGPFVEIFGEQDYGLVPSFRGKPGDTIIDAGAHVGFYALWQARAMETGQIFAFEPNPDVYKHLKYNLSANGFGWIKTYPYALSARQESLILIASGRESTVAATVHDGDGIAVKAWTLDQLVETEGIKKIDVLKMDTEGAEAEIVKGGLTRAIPITERIVMESHNTRYDVLHLLEPFGFRLVHDGRDPNIVYFERQHG
jgi:FkbM family methyltransferase